MMVTEAGPMARYLTLKAGTSLSRDRTTVQPFFTQRVGIALELYSLAWKSFCQAGQTTTSFMASAKVVAQMEEDQGLKATVHAARCRSREASAELDSSKNNRL